MLITEGLSQISPDVDLRPRKMKKNIISDKDLTLLAWSTMYVQGKTLSGEVAKAHLNIIIQLVAWLPGCLVPWLPGCCYKLGSLFFYNVLGRRFVVSSSTAEDDQLVVHRRESVCFVCILKWSNQGIRAKRLIDNGFQGGLRESRQ